MRSLNPLGGPLCRQWGKRWRDSCGKGWTSNSATRSHRSCFVFSGSKCEACGMSRFYLQPTQQVLRKKEGAGWRHTASFSITLLVHNSEMLHGAKSKIQLEKTKIHTLLKRHLNRNQGLSFSYHPQAFGGSHPGWGVCLFVCLFVSIGLGNEPRAS